MTAMPQGTLDLGLFAVSADDYEITAREREVLESLRVDGPQTADEFVTRREAYINSWAPVFTRLKQGGLAATTGETRPTSHGSHAAVVAITDAGREALGCQ